MSRERQSRFDLNRGCGNRRFHGCLAAFVLLASGMVCAADGWYFLPVGGTDCPELIKLTAAEIAENTTPAMLKTVVGIGDKAAPPVWHRATFPHTDFDKLLPADNQFGWYACTFSAPVLAESSGLILRLGMIDDADVTYLNGVQVGAMGDSVQQVSAWDIDREYRVPPNVAREGDNLLLVRVWEKSGLAGMKGIPVFTLPLVPAGSQWQTAPVNLALPAGVADSAPLNFNTLETLPSDFPNALDGRPLTWSASPIPDTTWNARLGAGPVYGIYRLAFSDAALPPETETTEILLDLGPVHDVAAVFVNGKRIGLIGRFPVPERPVFVETGAAGRCILPRTLVKPGENELTVIVYNDAALGGLPGIPGVLMQPELALSPFRRELARTTIGLYSLGVTSAVGRMNARVANNDLAPDDAAACLSLALYAAWLDWRDRETESSLKAALDAAGQLLKRFPDETFSQSGIQALCDIFRQAEIHPEVMALVRSVFPHFGVDCIYLGQDRTTRGDWQMNYGQRFYVLSAMGQLVDWQATGRRPPLPYRLSIPGDRDIARLWLAAVNRELSDPAVLFKHGDYKTALIDTGTLSLDQAAISLLPAENIRRASWWDDHGEVHPCDEAGPDLLVTVDLTTGWQTLSFYLLDFDWRDTRHPRQQSLLLFDRDNKLLNAAWSGKIGAGLYERFALCGDRPVTTRIFKNRGPCVAVSGFFVDLLCPPTDIPKELSGKISPEDMTWYTGLTHLNGEALIREARQAVARRDSFLTLEAGTAGLFAYIMTTEAAMDVDRATPAFVRRLREISDPNQFAQLAQVLQSCPESRPRWFYLLCARFLECSDKLPPEEEKRALTTFIKACNEKYEIYPLQAILVRHWRNRGLPQDDPFIIATLENLPKRSTVKSE